MMLFCIFLSVTTVFGVICCGMQLNATIVRGLCAWAFGHLCSLPIRHPRMPNLNPCFLPNHVLFFFSSFPFFSFPSFLPKKTVTIKPQTRKAKCMAVSGTSKAKCTSVKIGKKKICYWKGAPKGGNGQCLPNVDVGPPPPQR